MAFPNKIYQVIPGQIDLEGVSTDVTVKDTALGACICDITSNSCDAYCCCDTDCNPKVLEFWNQNYNTYCAKNFIASTYRPQELCVSNKHLYSYNKRMGMSVTETDT